MYLEFTFFHICGYYTIKYLHSIKRNAIAEYIKMFNYHGITNNK